MALRNCFWATKYLLQSTAPFLFQLAVNEQSCVKTGCDCLLRTEYNQAPSYHPELAVQGYRGRIAMLQASNQTLIFSTNGETWILRQSNNINMVDCGRLDSRRPLGDGPPIPSYFLFGLRMPPREGLPPTHIDTLIGRSWSLVNIM